MHITEVNVMILPDHVPGYKSSDIQLLPSSATKCQVWEPYQQATSVDRINAPSELFHLYLPLVAASSSCGGDEINELSMLDVPKE